MDPTEPLLAGSYEAPQSRHYQQCGESVAEHTLGGCSIQRAMTIKKEIANVFVRMFFVIAMLTTIWALPYSTDSDQTPVSPPTEKTLLLYLCIGLALGFCTTFWIAYLVLVARDRSVTACATHRCFVVIVSIMGKVGCASACLGGFWYHRALHEDSWVPFLLWIYSAGQAWWDFMVVAKFGEFMMEAYLREPGWNPFDSLIYGV